MWKQNVLMDFVLKKSNVGSRSVKEFVIEDCLGMWKIETF